LIFDFAGRPQGGRRWLTNVRVAATPSQEITVRPPNWQAGLSARLSSGRLAHSVASNAGRSRAEFPPDVQNRMMLGSLGMVGGAIMLFVVVIVALVALNS
jgi:hypothetical protein